MRCERSPVWKAEGAGGGGWEFARTLERGGQVKESTESSLETVIFFLPAKIAIRHVNCEHGVVGIVSFFFAIGIFSGLSGSSSSWSASREKTTLCGLVIGETLRAYTGIHVVCDDGEGRVVESLIRRRACVQTVGIKF